MKSKLAWIAAAFAITLATQCSAAPETVVYSHGAGFRVAVPAGWGKIKENDQVLLFCCNKKRLIEAGGYHHPLTIAQLKNLTEASSDSLLGKFKQEQLAIFNAENGIRDVTIMNEGKAQWAGHPAYQLQARGYSDRLRQNVIMDVRMLLHKDNAMVYALAIQVPADEYAGDEALIRNVINSFQVID